MLALEARKRVKGSGSVVAVDVSADALSECRRKAEPAENVAPLACVVGDALHIPLASQSIDVVMTRSVLIYLGDKQAGVRELYRVLKPRGRASIFEPINEVWEQVRNRVRASGFYDGLQPEWGEIQNYYEARKEDWWGTLVGWDERELIGWFEAAGFARVKVSYELIAGLRVRKPKKTDIAAGIRGRPNPNTPSYEEVAREVLADMNPSHAVSPRIEPGGKNADADLPRENHENAAADPDRRRRATPIHSIKAVAVSHRMMIQ